MNDKDKIQINAYLDGELNEIENIQIEKLINNDEDAKEYLNNLKMINNELIAEAKSELDSIGYKDSRKFVQENILPKLESNKLNLQGFLKISNFKHVFAYSLVAALFFNFGLQNESIIGISSSDKGEYNLLKLRSKDSTNLQIKKILDDMIQNKYVFANIDSENYDSLVIFSTDAKSNCILFEFSGPKNSIGKYCPDENFFQINEID